MQTRECTENVVFFQAGVTSHEVRDSEMPKTKSKREVQKSKNKLKSKTRKFEVQRYR